MAASALRGYYKTGSVTPSEYQAPRADSIVRLRLFCLIIDHYNAILLHLYYHVRETKAQLFDGSTYSGGCFLYFEFMFFGAYLQSTVNHFYE